MVTKAQDASLRLPARADCGEGPVVMVDEQTYENVDSESAAKLADLLVKGKLDQSKKFVSYEQNLVNNPSKSS